VVRFQVAVVFAICWTAVPPVGSYATDYFLIVGGGPDPYSNQVSLESNVLYVLRLLDVAGVEPTRRICLFSDGSDPRPDNHFYDRRQGSAELHGVLAHLSGDDEAFGHVFRNHRVSSASGPATKKALVEALRKLAQEVKAGDRVFLYATGHGSKGEPASNARLELWEDDRLSVRELAAELDRFDPAVEVILVMVQCYSGSFGNVIFAGGLPDREVASHRRAGFFATVETRGAAGCTPEIEEESYREYSTYFWAALSQETRTGQRIEPADYDGDGSVSLAEAHAYVLLQSDTIDVPIKTSDVFLRRFGRLSGHQEGLLSLDDPFEDLLQQATPVERAVLEGLSSQLQLSGSDRLRQARELKAKLEREQRYKDRLQKRLEHHGRQQGTALWEQLLRRWPQLKNPWRPDTMELVLQRGEEVLSFLKGQPGFQTLQSALAEGHALDVEKLRLEEQWAKVERFCYTAESVALRVNLPKVVDQPLVERFHQLLALEQIALPLSGKNSPQTAGRN
jgi:hypothetical protein